MAKDDRGLLRLVRRIIGGRPWPAIACVDWGEQRYKSALVSCACIGQRDTDQRESNFAV